MYKNYLIALGVCLVFLCGILVGRHTAPTMSPVSTDTSLTVKHKESKGSPDLEVSTKYVATINNKKVEVPVSAQRTPASAASGGATPYTATISQTIDVTSAAKAVLPDWSVGIGVGRHKSDWYVPVSFTRHYKTDRALSVEVHLSDLKTIKGVEVQHQWSF